MFDYRNFALRRLATMAPRYLPFADVATDDVPLSRLLRLSLFQVTVGMALVMLVGTLNRVMIVELSVPATLVAGMLALPLIFAPLRTFIGYRSDTHRSALGWRRVPYIWKGTLYQFGGFAIMPFALLVLSGYGEAIDAPRWIGLSAAVLSFLLNFPIRLISRRKPFTGSVVPRHGRMASVPFPLLIDGKTGQNALIPGGPRMANFPIRLISHRKPFTGSIIGRHARMASFPIGLISRRQPFTGSAIPRHGRMANLFLPLTIRRDGVASEHGGEGFSFSKLIGARTLVRKRGR